MPSIRRSPAAGALLRLLAATFLAVAAACSEEPPPPALTIGDVGVPEAAIADLSEAERATLADLIAFGSAVAAETSDSLIAPIVRRDTESQLISAMPLHLGGEAMSLTDEDLRAAYASAPEWELVVRHVVRLVEPGDPRAVADSAQAVAERVRERAAAGDDFAALAGEYSQEPGAAERGGRLEPGRRGSWVEPFWATASRLAPGEVSPVVETEYGFHVLRLDDRRPVPFGEASRTELLRRIVPTATASVAMEEWAGTAGAILVDPPAIPVLQQALETGTAIPDTLVIARGAAGGDYSGDDFAAGWARLTPEERSAVEGGGGAALAAWAEDDGREAIWARHARSMGIEVAPAAVSAARLRWQGRILGWAAGLGFRPGLSGDQVREVALQSLRSGAAGARFARAELPSLRPLLRKAYPVVSLEL